MKAISTKNHPRTLWDLSKEVAPGFIRLTRRGKPFAYVLLASDYDEEDVGYMIDASFWEMIQERRKSEKWIPLEQVKAELCGPLRSTRHHGANGRKKEKRNGTARS